MSQPFVCGKWTDILSKEFGCILKFVDKFHLNVAFAQPRMLLKLCNHVIWSNNTSLVVISINAVNLWGECSPSKIQLIIKQAVDKIFSWRTTNLATLKINVGLSVSRKIIFES